MVKPSLSFVMLLAAGLLVSACGNYAKREECLATSDPTCVNDPEPTLPDLVGPNPNFPNPTAFQLNLNIDETPGKTPLLLSELFLDPVGENAGAQKLELWNSGNSDFDAAGFALRLGNENFELPQGTILPAGGFIVVHIGQAGYNDHANVYAAQLGALGADAGDVMLVSSAGMVADYVQWGASGQPNEADAVAEGQWNQGDYVLPPVVEGASINYLSTVATNDSKSFRAAWPSLGTAGAE